MRPFLAALILFFAGVALAAEVMPPAPKQYFNDYANVVSSATAQNLNRTLEDFERATSSQILVAIFPTMQSDSSIEDYTYRVKESWHVGQKGKDNGAVLFVFPQDRKMFIQVGYGLEGALPDALCKRIVSDEIAPRFKAGDYDGGLTAGVNAILAATKGEYQGTGQTVADANPQNADDSTGSLIPAIFIFGIFLLIVIVSLSRHNGTVYQSNGMSGLIGGIIGAIISNSGRGGGNWGGGSGAGGGSWGGGSGGGGFSGGGGSGGGGGAGGSW